MRAKVILLPMLFFLFPHAASTQGKLPDAVKLEKDVPYAANDNPRQRLDILLPKKASEKPLPVIVFIHGGAWLAGDRKGGWSQLTRFVATGNYAGVSVGYRLSSEAIWPAQIHDCKAAIRWIRANAKKYNFDPERIGVMGTSAGGHLVAMLGVSGGIEKLEGKLGDHATTSSGVQCVVDLFGPTDLLTMGDFPSKIDHDSPNSPESKLVGGAVKKRSEIAKKASPVNFVSKDDPPFLIIHGDKDPLVPFNQSERFHAALKKAGVSSVLVTMQGGGHGGFRNRDLPERIGQFFDRYLRDGKAKIAEETLSERK